MPERSVDPRPVGVGREFCTPTPRWSKKFAGGCKLFDQIAEDQERERLGLTRAAPKRAAPKEGHFVRKARSPQTAGTAEIVPPLRQRRHCPPSPRVRHPPPPAKAMKLAWRNARQRMIFDLESSPLQVPMPPDSPRSRPSSAAHRVTWAGGGAAAPPLAAGTV